MYLNRLLEKPLAEAARAFPAVVITGPRQSGKSTLLQYFLKARKGSLLSLEDPRIRGLLAEDAQGYLKQLPRPVILDEIQYWPDITLHVKILVDADRKPGQWFLTGSQQFAVMRHVSESMAGRAAILALPTLQLKERKTVPSLESFVTGSTFPEPVVKRAVRPALWYSSYLQTYLERDVRTQLGVTDLRDFEQLIRLLAARTSQVLNYSALAQPLGISVPTVKRWVSMLEASYLIHLLPPFHENYGKRIIKAPKIYFLDPGLVAYLLNLDQGPPVLNGPMAGVLFETAVVSEILKSQYGRGERPSSYYWRSQDGHEIDLLMPGKGGYIPCEIKLASRVRTDHAANIRHWLALASRKDAGGTLITNSREDLALSGGIRNIHWSRL